MKTLNAKIKLSKNRKWLRRILIALSIVVLVPISLFTIGWLNRDTVIDVLQEWYRDNTTGTLTIGKVNASFLSDFPRVGFTLKDIIHTNTDTISEQYASFQIEETKLVIGAGNLLRGHIIFEKITLKNAVYSSEVRSNKSLAHHEQLKKLKQESQPKGFQIPKWIDKNGATFSLNNVKYITKDSILKKHFNLDIHHVKGTFKGNDAELKGDAFLDITVNDLGFNTNKGSFFNGAHANGKTTFIVDLKKDRIELPEFPLKIDDQTFQLTANFDLSEATKYKFRLENTLTDFDAIKGLLSDSLSIKLKNFDIQKPFKSSIKLEGNFAYGNNPDIHATYASTDNQIEIGDKFQLKNVSFSGHLTNDVYTTDSLRKTKKSPKDIKVAFNTFNAALKDIKIDVHNAYFQSTPEALNFFEADLQLKGSNEALATVLETDNFDFKGGTFQLDAFISGDIPNPYGFLNSATGTFNLNNTQVILKKNGLQLPIEAIDLDLERGNSFLRKLAINLPNDENLILKGHLKNISALLAKFPKSTTSSQISLDSKNLNINEVLSMAKNFVTKSESKLDDRKTLHETLETVYNKFHPQFDINIGTLQYNDVMISDLKSKIEFINSETILLRNFDFRYDDALTNLNGSVKVHGPESPLKDAIHINAQATSKGSLNVFKDLFNIELFRIDSGDFKFYGDVTGNVKEFSEILNNARGDLTLTKTQLHYAPAELDLEIDSLSLFVNNADILLKKFTLEIGELYPITLNGSIKQFPNFLLDNIKDPGSIFLNVNAAFLDGDDLLATVNSFKNEDNIKQPKNKKALQHVFKDINTFNPEIELNIDSLKYKGLITENIKALIYFENDSILKLDHLNLKYKETVANIYGEVNAHTHQESVLNDNPFDLDFSVSVKGKSQDLNDYLKTTNFIFKAGDFEFNGKYKGQAKDLKLLNTETFGDLKIGGTLVDFKPAGLKIPVDSLHIEINNDLATLKTLDIQLPGKSEVYFSGAIDHFSDFINGSNENIQHSSNFAINAPYLDTSDVVGFMASSTATNEQSDAENLKLKKLKDALVKINTSFNPSIAVKIDTLRHDNFNITDLGTELFFDNRGNFKIEDTQLHFHGGTMAMTMDVGLANNNNIPVAVDIQVNNVDIQELLSRLDYLHDEDLKQAEKIEGILNYNINADGILDNDGKLNMNTLNGTLQLNLENFALYNYKPIMENTVLMKDERFKNLRFRPIVQTFEIKDGTLIIPRTEIQSSAIHVFVEGTLKFEEYMNIWLSIPWKNLKNNEGLTLPEKTTYDAAGAKFYVQLVQDKTSKKERQQKLKVKFRLGNRKLRKLRDSLN